VFGVVGAVGGLAVVVAIVFGIVVLSE
jgi:hypothetical protein